MTIKDGRFWMVWCPEKSAPTHRHISRDAAEREAERLSSSNHGLTFYVLKAVGGTIAHQPKLRKIKMVGRHDPDFEIPF